MADPDEPSIELGDRVESILTGGDAVGIVLELLPGLGLRTIHAVKALRKLTSAGASPEQSSRLAEDPP